MISADFDVGRQDVLDDGRRSAEADRFTARFNVIVNDVVGSGTGPACNGLRVLPGALEIGQVRIADGGIASLERDSALGPDFQVPMDINAVEVEVLRH